MNTAMIDNRLYYGFDSFSKSEIRIIRNKIRRQQIVKRQRVFLVSVLSIIISIIISLTATVMIKAQDNTLEPECKYYKVVVLHAGDTLWTKASEYYSEDNYKDYDSFINEICRINHLESPEELKAGENVVIPYYDEFRAE